MKIKKIIPVLFLAVMFGISACSSSGYSAEHSTGKKVKAANPCNPCNKKPANPCNPCGQKKWDKGYGKTPNPCNPCNKHMKKMNPCNPCNKRM